MEDQFNLSLNENIFLAKKTLVENIYYAAKIEGVNVTFPQTKTILEGVSVSNLNMDDVQKILNLRNAWRYTLNHIEQPFVLEFIKKINEFVAYNESIDWGVLRYGNVGISGVNYQPTIPVESEVNKHIHDILSIPCVTERALTYMLWAMREQLFWDGNKRTSLIAANKILIKNGKGIITIEESKLEEFNERLTKFYETNDYSQIIYFLYDSCLYGIDYK
ncbi:filamentation induced by cAMP protein fic [Alkalibacillus silvisoli]|uniref:Fic family protein n=1 Tax=Alkalibacillus silvisoli TaxID=392823 RepID=A0ABP3JGY3_9BACI